MHLTANLWRYANDTFGRMFVDLLFFFMSQ